MTDNTPRVKWQKIIVNEDGFEPKIEDSKTVLLLNKNGVDIDMARYVFEYEEKEYYLARNSDEQSVDINWYSHWTYACIPEDWME
jgi:hypothetical protein